MGFWEQDEQGRSFRSARGKKMVWGDDPADAIDRALKEVKKCKPRPTPTQILAKVKMMASGRYPKKPSGQSGAWVTALTYGVTDAIAAFEEVMRRSPTPKELIAGVRFSLGMNKKLKSKSPQAKGKRAGKYQLMNVA